MAAVTISAGSSVAVSLAAGSAMRLSGMGSAQIAPPGVPGAGSDTVLRPVGAGESSFGPYLVSVTINVSAAAGGRGVIYNVTQPGDVNNAAGAQQLSAVQAQALQAFADSISPRLTQIPYLISGCVLPSSGALTNTIGSGDAVINDKRLLVPATSVTFPASKDNYVDLTQDGIYVLVSVANGATAGMAVTPNSLRIGKVVTGASTISSSTTRVMDPQANWMGNTSERPGCVLGFATGQVFAAAAANVIFNTGSTIFDNANHHSEGINNTRITIMQTGVYALTGGVSTVAGGAALDAVSFFKNGSSNVAQFPQITAVNNNAHAYSISAHALLVPGDYIELNYNPTSSTVTLNNAWLSCFRIG